jgi:hypothetical protein
VRQSSGIDRAVADRTLGAADGERARNSGASDDVSVRTTSIAETIRRSADRDGIDEGADVAARTSYAATVI